MANLIDFNLLSYYDGKIKQYNKDNYLKATLINGERVVDDSDAVGVTIGSLSNRLNLTVLGDLTVQGTQHIVDTETLQSQATLIITNSTGAPLTQYTGIVALTGQSSEDSSGVYDAIAAPIYDHISSQSHDSLKLGVGKYYSNTYADVSKRGTFEFNLNQAQSLATRADNIVNNHLVMWDDSNYTLVDAGVKGSELATKDSVGKSVSCIRLDAEYQRIIRVRDNSTVEIQGTLYTIDPALFNVNTKEIIEVKNGVFTLNGVEYTLVYETSSPYSSLRGVLKGVTDGTNTYSLSNRKTITLGEEEFYPIIGRYLHKPSDESFSLSAHLSPSYFTINQIRYKILFSPWQLKITALSAWEESQGVGYAVDLYEGILDNENAYIDWGDGTVNRETSHVYEEDDDFTIKIYGVNKLNYIAYKVQDQIDWCRESLYQPQNQSDIDNGFYYIWDDSEGDYVRSYTYQQGTTYYTSKDENKYIFSMNIQGTIDVQGVSNSGYLFDGELNNLEDLNIGSGWVSNMFGIFSYLPNLQDFSILRFRNSYGGIPTLRGQQFSYSHDIKKLDIPQCSHISYSIYNSDNVEEIVLPSLLVSLSDSLYNLPSLKRITFNSIVPPTISGQTFFNTNNCPIYVPIGSIEAYKEAYPQVVDRIRGAANAIFASNSQIDVLFA